MSSWTHRVSGVVAASIALVVALVVAPSTAATAADTGTVVLGGRVTVGDASTAPASGQVKVHYSLNGYAGTYSPSVAPDASGNYTITGTPGQYTLFFEYVGAGSIASVFWGGPTFYDSTFIDATSNVSNLNITLPPRAVLSGQVSLGVSGSHPGPGVSITFYPYTSGGGAPIQAQVTTGSDGQFSLALNPGQYQAIFSATGYQSKYWDGQAFAGSNAIVSIGVQARSGINLTLPSLGTIAGHVDTGSAGHSATAGQVQVSWTGTVTTSPLGSVLTNSSGDYLITGLQSDTYTLAFSDVADHDYQAPRLVDSVIVTDTAVNVTAPVTTMSSTASISGQVLLGGSGHAAGAGDVEVSFDGPLSDGSLPTFVAQTDASGRYSISGLQSGSYTLWFRYAGSGQFADEYWQDSYQYSTATPVSVGTVPVVRDVTLVASGSISGVLSGPTGALASPTVLAYFVDANGNRSSDFDSLAKVNPDGTFQFARLRPGSYDIRFFDSNQWYHQTSTLVNGVTVTVTAGENTDLGTNVLKTPATIYGAVTCAGCFSSNALDSTASIEARATPTSAWVAVNSQWTTSSGFVFSGLMPGEYRVHFWGGTGCLEAISSPVTVAEGQAVSIALTDRCPSGNLPILTGPPRGSLDTVNAGLGTVSVSGWALDPDTSEPIAVALYVDGKSQGQTQADQTRSDIGAAYPGYGSAHGYAVTLLNIPTGPHTVCAYGINAGPSASNTTLGCRTVTVAVANPIGTLETVTSSGPGSASLSGWALDADASDPLAVHVYVDGAFNSVLSATGTRTDVGNAYPGTGAAHGYSTTLTSLSAGGHSVCTYGINQGSGTNVLLGCHSIAVLGGSPFGSVDSTTITGPGAVTLGGWAIDPDTAASISVHAYVDGGYNSQVTANGPRVDISAAFTGYGAAHGFTAPLTGLSGGSHTVCLYGINQFAGSNSTLGCKTVTVPTGSPFGSVDSVTGSSGGIAISGWALDPDVAASIDVHVYVDGVFNSVVTASGSRPDIASAFPGYGAAHGFSTTVAAVAGSHTVCVYGINQGATANNSMIGSKCSQVVVPAG